MGPNQSEGLTPLDDFFDNSNQIRNGIRGNFQTFQPHIYQPATITWTARPGIGYRPIYRSHQELIAAGIMHILEMGLSNSDRILNPYPLTSLIGLSSSFLPSLITGGYIIQHHPFDYDAFVNQIKSELITHAIVPSSVLKSFVDNHILSGPAKTLNSIGCVWQTPYDIDHHKIDTMPTQSIYDIRNLNETAVTVNKRQSLSDQGYIKLGESNLKLSDDKKKYSA